MSDHWNSLANLLGTPSLAPPKPKADPAPGSALTGVNTPPASSTPLAEPAFPRDAALEESPEVVEKPKAEKSRLKTSWDAVASFFGVTTKEASETVGEVAEDPVPRRQEVAPKSSGSGKSPTKKGKPSMWGGASVENEESPEPVKSSENSRREKNTRESSERRTPRRESQSRELPESNDRMDPGSRSDSDREPDRRSHRRPPRRGRDAENRGENSPPADREQPQREVPAESRTRRSSSSRHSSSASSSSRAQSSSSLASESRPAKKSSGFGAGIDRLEGSFDDDFESRDHTIRSRDDRDLEDDSNRSGSEREGTARSESEEGADQELRSRRRRRRGGRGRKQRDDADSTEIDQDTAPRSDRKSRDDDEISEDDAPTVRHSKIPTWTETIHVLVEANMLNHQRSQSSSRGNPRGRGRR